MRWLIFIFLIEFIYSGLIKNYKPKKGCIKNSNEYLVVLREFKKNNKNYYLALNPNSLNTTIINSTFLLAVCPKKINNSRYYMLLLKSINNPSHPLINDGIKSFNNGIFLTTDLCPSSKKGFEKRLYEKIINQFKNPVPVTIFITKRWIDSHKIEFNQLKKWQQEKKLNIIWGNHTALHIYHPKMPLEKNFVLSKEENLTKDILLLEKTLLENNITPSIFFRFPGLISNKEAINKVANLGLITIGANKWLVKDKDIKEGSIILVHGNKNEPKGVDIFFKLLKNNKIKKLNSLNKIQ